MQGERWEVEHGERRGRGKEGAQIDTEMERDSRRGKNTNLELKHKTEDSNQIPYTCSKIGNITQQKQTGTKFSNKFVIMSSLLLPEWSADRCAE